MVEDGDSFSKMVVSDYRLTHCYNPEDGHCDPYTMRVSYLTYVSPYLQTLPDYSFMITEDTKLVFVNSCGLSRMRTYNSVDSFISVLYMCVWKVVFSYDCACLE
jgi:hypothetical protein